MLTRNRKRGATVIALRRPRRDAVEARPAPMGVLHPAHERAEVIDLARVRVRRRIEEFEPQGGDAA
jgi:hypothetical protein